MSKFKRLLRPRNVIIFFLVFSAVVIFSGILATRAGLNYQFTRLNSGQQLVIGSDYIAVGNLGAISRKIVNNSGTDYFIPTNSVDEWNRFVAATPGLGVYSTPDFCGNGTCGTDMTNPSLPRVESYTWCPSDCSAPSLYCGDGSCNNGETCYSCSGDCVCSCNFAPDCPGYPGNTLVSYTCDNSIGYCVDAFPWVECTLIPPELEGLCSFDQCWHSDQAGTCTEHLAPTW